MTAIPHTPSEPLAYSHAGPFYEAYRILQIGFVVVPIIAGIDKFFHLLVNWDQYLAPAFSSIIGGQNHVFMMIAGVLEIIAGIGIALKPKYFGYIVAIWLALIIINLFVLGAFFDIALRDFGLALGALALGRLAQNYDLGPAGGLMTRKV